MKPKDKFQSLLNKWNEETRYTSFGIFENKNFKKIVSMEKDAVPFIYEELQKGDTLLVHALDLIFPGVITYEGFVPLHDACEAWRNILSKHLKSSK